MRCYRLRVDRCHKFLCLGDVILYIRRLCRHTDCAGNPCIFCLAFYYTRRFSIRLNKPAYSLKPSRLFSPTARQKYPRVREREIWTKCFFLEGLNWAQIKVFVAKSRFHCD